MAALCPRCGRENSGAYSFCYQCGTGLHRKGDARLSIAGGLSILASLLCFPYFFLGIFGVFSLFPGSSNPALSPSMILLGVVAGPAFFVGFTGGLFALEARNLVVVGLGFIFMILAGIISMLSALSFTGELVLLFSAVGALLTLIHQSDSSN